MVLIVNECDRWREKNSTRFSVERCCCCCWRLQSERWDANACKRCRSSISWKACKKKRKENGEKLKKKKRWKNDWLRVYAASKVMSCSKLWYGSSCIVCNTITGSVWDRGKCFQRLRCVMRFQCFHSAHSGLVTDMRIHTHR